ncbi:MAG: GNAT family N-acetyltransferase [Candidatus Thiodiazotropha sp.]
MERFYDQAKNEIRWPSTASELQSPSYGYEWFSACAEALCSDKQQHIVSVTGNDRFQAVAPLCVKKKKGVAWLEIMGVAELHEPGGLIYTNPDALTALCKSILKEGKPTQLGRLPEDDLSVESFQALARKRGLVLNITNSGSPYIEIDCSWEDYFSSLSSRRRQDYRRARRRLADQGEVSVDIHRPDQAQLQPLLEEAFRVEQANWKGRNNSAINCRPELKRFFSAYFSRLSDSGRLIISSLRLDGEMIAVQLLVEHSNRWWILKIGYDERWAKYSPGMQLMFETLSEAFERKLTAFELLGTEESWINIWPHKTHRFITIVYFPYNLTGLGALFVEAASKLLTRLGNIGILRKSS